MSDFGKGINVPSKDIVYRQDVEDMLRNALPSRGMWEIEGDVVKNTICETVVDLMMDLEKLPSAQPETHDKRTETHGVCLDAIDRQASKRMTERNVGLRNATNDKKAWSE